jgi:acetoin utilization deacetylase AcuC-like enzyme
MLVVYCKDFEDRYRANPVENPDRARLPAMQLREAGYEFVKPAPASLEDISKAHSKEHIDRVKDSGHYAPARLAAGGAVAAAELAVRGEPAFALIRPPGHHASYNRAWGMCYFNNMAIAIKKIKPIAKRALIIDIDLHFGDGTVSIFRGDNMVKIVNPGAVDIDYSYLGMDCTGYLAQIEKALQESEFDVIGVSAGFDTYEKDWGGLLRLEDYREIGRLIRKGSEKCQGRRFAILEGGYHTDLRLCVKSFVEGFG